MNNLDAALDIERFRRMQEKSIDMLFVMHAALSEIARSEVSLDGGVAMRYIAEQSILRVREITATLEVKNDEITN